MEVRIRVIKAGDDPISTEKYIRGHYSVLESYGVTKVTSADRSWVSNPNTYLLIVESMDELEVYGGGRVQLKSQHFPLPLESAIEEKDIKIKEYVKRYNELEVAELCGVWNSKKIAGYGIGSIFLIRAGVIVSSILKLENLMGFCSPFTLKNCQNLGFKVIEDLGDRGSFFYPKEGLLATITEITDLEKLPYALPEEQEKILFLKENPQHVACETSPKGDFRIMYDLKI
ncbi:MAG TPA: hypothetical protein VKZ51_13685 [Cyclobacteriaceae bacterium]|nr:hypothetical protein [Cyclobacteriaceae bacterium]